MFEKPSCRKYHIILLQHICGIYDGVLDPYQIDEEDEKSVELVTIESMDVVERCYPDIVQAFITAKSGTESMFCPFEEIIYVSDHIHCGIFLKSMK